jgi:SpoVK/Ycf46/Vps4 family AAA+-type ATPase
MTFADEVETLIRARYPILYILSTEEMRVQKLIQDIAQKRQKKVFEWSYSTGLVPAGTSIQSQKHRNAPTKDPIVALDQVIDQVEPAIFVFKDFHHFLTRTNFAVVRKLKDIALHLKNSLKTIVLICPSLEIPAELEKEITVLNHPLPTREDFSALLDRIIEDVKQFKQVKIELDDAGRERLLQAALGLTLGEAENVFAKIIVKDERLSGDDVNEVFAEKQQIIRKSGLLEYYATDENFSNVGGLSMLKEWLQKRSLAFTEQARAFGLPAPKGILLLGVQGCGKSLCAKAIAAEWGLALLQLDAGALYDKFVGESEKNLRHALRAAEAMAPCVLWIDEIEKGFAARESASDGGLSRRILGTLLSWMQERKSPVFLVATANETESLPPELLRKGRFDEIFFVDLPSEAARRTIFAIHLARRRQDPKRFDLALLARTCPGFSGAEIEAAVVAALYAAFAAKAPLADTHVVEALRAAVPLSRTCRESIDALRAWAAGRAVPAANGDQAPGDQSGRNAA